MKVPLELAYRNLRKTEYHENLIRDKVRKLEQFCDYINSCHVSIEKEHQHQKIGRPFRVRITLTIPQCKEIIIDRDPNRGSIHKTLESEIRDAFNAAARQLKKIKRKQRGQVKRHPWSKKSMVEKEALPAEIWK
jgi:ribosome-associated translation inhibitor RaiA